MLRFFAQPFVDFLNAFDRGVGRQGAPALLWVAIGCGLAWWVYVPVHELMHAWGCLAFGGAVSELDIAEGYGGSYLQKIFPYVRVGSDYAGQLTGFDTRGSDFVYAVTVFFPYLLTLFPGVPLLLRTTSQRHPGAGALLLLGAALPLAWAPLLSFTGDYYELGSIVVSRLAESAFGVAGNSWRSDDLFRIAGPIFSGKTDFAMGDLIGIALSFLVGLLLAFSTYALGRRLARAIGWRGEPELMRGR